MTFTVLNIVCPFTRLESLSLSLSQTHRRTLLFFSKYIRWNFQQTWGGGQIFHYHYERYRCLSTFFRFLKFTSETPGGVPSPKPRTEGVETENKVNIFPILVLWMTCITNFFFFYMYSVNRVSHGPGTIRKFYAINI